MESVSVERIKEDNRRLIARKVWFYLLLVSFFASLTSLTVRLYGGHLRAVDGPLGISVPGWVNSGSMMLLWELWALFSLIVIIALIFWLGSKA